MTNGRRSVIIARLVTLGAVAVVAAACGGGGGGGAPQIGPGAESVIGFLVMHRDARAGPEDALGPLPAEAGGVVNQGFDQALAHADWEIAGEQQSGVTSAMGALPSTICSRADTRCRLPKRLVVTSSMSACPLRLATTVGRKWSVRLHGVG